MGRTPLVVDMEKMRKVVEEVERGGPLPNLSMLCKIISQRMGNISPQVVRLRLTSENVPVKTVAGRRGRPGNCGGGNPYTEELGKRHIAAIRKMIPLATRKKDVETFNLSMKSLRNLEESDNPFKRMKAAVRLKCLECATEIVEVRECTCVECPLWLIRPSK
jgi:hypothetical protein